MGKFSAALAAACTVLVFISCASSPLERIDLPPALETVPETMSEKPEPPKPPENIIGKGMVSGEKLKDFLLLHNTQVDADFVGELSGFYIDEAAKEGVDHDIAFAQMCLETGFLRYGNDVKPEQNNYCGLGATGNREPGLSFPDPQTGVRAHIQHLKAYASDEPLNEELVDPRYRYVRLGSSPTIHGLAGTWAADKMYSEKIANLLQRLYDFAF